MRVVATLTALTAALAIGAPASVASASPAASRSPTTRAGVCCSRSSADASTEPPLHRSPVPQHPYLAANDASIIHNDAWQTDTYDRAGPVGPDLVVSSTSSLIRDCSSLSFLPDGTMLTVCIGVGRPVVKALDPDTLAEIASYQLPKRDPGLLPDTSNFSGGYFYLDHRGRLVVSNAENHVLWLRLDGDGVRGRAGRRPEPGARDAADPERAPRLVEPDLVRHPGGHGRLRRTGRSHPHPPARGRGDRQQLRDRRVGRGLRRLRPRALPLRRARSGGPGFTWRKTYDRGTRVKPSQVSQGSGTTPTLIGRASLPSGGWIAITDNADPKMNVLVFTRGKDKPGSRPVCRQPVFPAGQGADENSLISVPGGLIAENNYGYGLQDARPPPADHGPRAGQDPRRLPRRRLPIAWANDTARIPSSVSKASLGSGLVYAYTHPAADELAYRVPLPLGRALPGRVVLHRVLDPHRRAGLEPVRRLRAPLQQPLRRREHRPRRRLPTSAPSAASSDRWPLVSAGPAARHRWPTGSR